MCRPASRSRALFPFSFFDILGRFFCHVQTNTTACSFPLILESGIFKFVIFDLDSSHFVSRRNIFRVGGGGGKDWASFVCDQKKKKKRKRKKTLSANFTAVVHWRFVIASKSRDRKNAVNLLRSCCKL